MANSKAYKIYDQHGNVLKSQNFYPAFGQGLGSYFLQLPGTDVEYTKKMNYLLSSAVMGCVQWLQRSAPEAPLIVQESVKGEWETVANHPVSRLMMHPNRSYSGELMLMSLWLYWCVAGEAFIKIDHNSQNRPVRLNWIPNYCVDPKQYDSSKLQQINAERLRQGLEELEESPSAVHYFTYKARTGSVDLPPEKVIHFRNGLDPLDPLHGLPPLRSVIRHVFSDEEAANFVASILRNRGVPGLIFSPDPAAGELMGDTDIEAMEEYISERFTGDYRGKPLVGQFPFKVTEVGFNPQELNITSVSDAAEERVSVLLGVPSAVAGFSAGLEQTRVGATMRELVRLAWNNGIIPPNRLMAAEISRVLLPKFERDPDRFRITHDYHAVQALQEDENERANRFATLVTSAIARRAEARRAMGLPVDSSDEVYHMNFSIIETGPGARPVPNFNTQNNNDDDEKSLTVKDLKQAHFIQQIIGQNARRVKTPPQVLRSLLVKLETDGRSLEKKFVKPLTEFFNDFGQQVERAAREVLDQKQAADDLLDAERIYAGLDILAIRNKLNRVYENFYELNAKTTITTIGEMLGLQTDIPDVTMRAILATGGRRAGLIDLDRAVKETLFEALTEGRSAGEGVDALVKRIRDWVPAGRYRDSTTRSRVMARTETKFSQNSSTLIRAKDAGIAMVMVHDDRLGHGDDECSERNGWIVSVEQGEALAELEHPNGSLSLTPIPPTLYAEMVESGQLADV